jgi:hypothetical protein
MRHGLPIDADVELVTGLQEFSARELGPIVSDDGVGHSKPVADAGKERHGLLFPEICDRAHLDPLGEFVYSNQ